MGTPTPIARSWRRSVAEPAPTDAAAAAARPVVKLRPGKGRRLAEGAPWAYADEIAMDRRTKALAPGSLVHLVSPEADWGLAAFNAESMIAARLLNAAPDAAVDAGWFADRVRAAMALRAPFYDAPFHRLIHAEGDALPGVVVDRFGDALVVQPNAAWADRLLGPLSEALMAETGATRLVVNGMGRARKLEGLETHLAVSHGEMTTPVPVPMNGATYLADLTGGQKTGLFYDQRANQAFTAQLAAGAEVLDVFSHVGGFALAALAGGATRALAIDSSAPALALAEEGARLTGVADRFAAERADAFEALEALGAEGAEFGLVVCDPPAFAPARQALEAGLRAYTRVARLAARVTARPGWLVLCSCSHAVDPESFRKACASGIAKAGRRAALVHSGRAGPDHPQHPGLPETSYLKALVFRLG